jgi:CO dehydrogenase maturation factor
MRVAVAGKGGSGKTSISGTMARVLARAGHDVLAIDGDPNPNLALTLGIEPERMDSLPTLGPEHVDRKPGGPELTLPLEELEASHSVTGPDGVRLLVMANPRHANTGCLCSRHAAVRSVIEVAATKDGDVCILDTEASPEHFSRGTARHADAVLLIVEPYFKSLETGRRMAALGRDLGLRVELVANKVRDDEERAAVRAFADRHDLPLAAIIPFDEGMPAAERARSAPLDFAGDGPAVQAIAELAEREMARG